MKADKGLNKPKKKAVPEKEPAPEMTPFQKKEKAKQQGQMSWILKMIEEGNEASPCVCVCVCGPIHTHTHTHTHTHL